MYAVVSSITCYGDFELTATRSATKKLEIANPQFGGKYRYFRGTRISLSSSSFIWFCLITRCSYDEVVFFSKPTWAFIHFDTVHECDRQN